MLFLTILAVSGLALSGVATIPYLSKILYKEPPKLPRPVYIDTIGLEERILKDVTKKNIIILNEGEFSYLLKKATKEQKIESLKANIDANKILLLAEVKSGKILYLTFSLKPKDSPGNFQISGLKVGYLPLPIILFRTFLPSKGIISIANIFPPGINIKDVRLEDKKMFITLK